MLQMEYRNGYHHNYLRLRTEWENNTKMRYQYCILTRRKPEGLLRAHIYSEDGENGLCYDISSKQSLSKYFLKGGITTEWMESLEKALKEALWSMEQYLMDYRNLILRPDCVFQDMDSGTIEFLYYPYYIEKAEPDMEEFLSFLLEHTDEGEPELLEIFYTIYAEWEKMPAEFTAETFLILWEKQKKAEKREARRAEEERELPLPEDEISIPAEKAPEAGSPLLGWYRKRRKEEKSASGYGARPVPEKQESKAEDAVVESWEESGRTTYLEVKPEKEEKKLFGNGKQNRKVISLESLPLIIGKKGGMADVVLTDSSVSRMHARITAEEEKIYLEDLNTTNGTYKNGVRLKPYERVELWKEDEIRLGKLEFTYR